MKISKVLRALIQEQLLSETPLMDVPYYTGKFSSSDGRRGSIGSKIPSSIKGKNRRGQYYDQAKLLLANSKENWYIVVLSDLGQNDDPADVIKTPEFQTWFKSLNIPKGSKIIVVDALPVVRDYTSANWAFAHDIIGHTIEKKIQRWLSNSDRKILYKLHELLPKEFLLSKDVNDMAPDVYAAIFAGKFPLEKALQATELITDTFLNKEQTEEKIRRYYEDVDAWIALIPYDEPTPVVPF